MLAWGGVGPQRFTPAIYRQIDRALRSDDMRRAMALARQALDAGLVDPILLHLRAIWRKQNGMPDAALADLQRALSLAPRSVELLAEAADSLNGMTEHRRAIVLAQEAIAFDRRFAAAWHQKGYAHQMLTELDAARECLQEAVRLDPRIADAHARLADMAVAQGDLSRARACAASALAADPGNAIAVLACVSADLAERRLNEARARLQTLLSDPETILPIRAVAQSRAGDLHDAHDQVEEAFNFYRGAGQLWKSCYEPNLRRQGHPPAVAQVRRIAAAVESLPPGAWR